LAFSTLERTGGTKGFDLPISEWQGSLAAGRDEEAAKSLAKFVARARVASTIPPVFNGDWLQGDDIRVSTGLQRLGIAPAAAVRDWPKDWARPTPAQAALVLVERFENFDPQAPVPEVLQRPGPEYFLGLRETVSPGRDLIMKLIARVGNALLRLGRGADR